MIFLFSSGLLKHARLALCLTLLMLSGITVHAQNLAGEALRLASFTAQPGPIRLTDVTSSVDLFIPVSSMVELRGARISLRYTHSIALRRERSLLLVRLNDITVAQIPVDPAQPGGVARFSVPDDLWQPGFNRLTIGVIQHYTDRCEDNLSPELWTELDLHESRLQFDLVAHTEQPTLSDLGAAFGPGIGAFGKVTVLSFADADEINAAALPLVAQALALRRRFVPLTVDHIAWPEAQYPTSATDPLVIVGTAEKIAELTGKPAPAVDGPHLAISRTPPVRDERGRLVNPGRLQLLVTGRHAAEVIEAARTLALMDDVFNPVASSTVIDRQQSPAAISPLSRLVLQPERSYTFADLGFPTQTLKGFGSRRVGVDVRLPADFYTHDSAQVELLLDLAYGAGMGPGSVMNVFLNGDFVHGRLLDEAHGATFNRYRIVLPARRFVPGRNKIDFELTLRPEIVPGECAGLDGRHLVAQILDTSSLTLPAFGAASSQPNLRLFGSTGFPFSSEYADTRFDLFIDNPVQTGAALTLIGRIAQASGAPHDGWRLHTGLENLDRSTRSIVLAPISALPEALFANSSVAFGRALRWPYTAINDTRTAGDAQRDSFSAWLIHQLGLQATPKPPAPFQDMLQGHIEQVSGLGPLGGLVLLANPLAKPGAAVLVVTAEDAERLDERVNALVQPQVWSQLDGSVLLWQNADSPVISAQVVDRFEMGTGSNWLLLRLWLSNKPWYWLALVLVGALLLAFAISAWLKRRQRGEHR